MAARTILLRVGDLDLEVEVVPVAGSEGTSAASRAAEGVVDAWEQAQRAIEEITVSVAGVIERSAKRAVRPDHLEVAFGLKISAKGNVVVAGASAEASLSVKVTYDAKPPPQR